MRAIRSDLAGWLCLLNFLINNSEDQGIIGCDAVNNLIHLRFMPLNVLTIDFQALF